MLAHELGHNLGALHDWFVTDEKEWSPDGQSDNHGWINYEDNWRTIMSYGDYCYQQSPVKGCPRIGYFSNPELIYAGKPIGLPAGSDVSCIARDKSRPPTCDANNARVFNLNLQKIANYRLSQLAVITPTPTHSPTPQPTHTPTATPSPTPTATPSIRINFQPDSAEVPAGNLADSGAMYGDQGNGYTYGWNATNRANTRRRINTAAPDPRYNTFIYMQRTSLYRWEIALPNGTYQVHVVAGDPRYYSGVFKINVEDVLLINGTPTVEQPWVAGSGVVNVTDGRLTLTNARGAVNNKLCLLEITALPHTPGEPTTPQPTEDQPFFSVTFAADGLQLSWMPNQTQNITDVKILRSATGNRSDAIELSHVLRTTRSATGSTFIATDFTASADATYHYWMVMSDDQSTVSEIGPVMEGAEDRLFSLYLPTVSK